MRRGISQSIQDVKLVPKLRDDRRYAYSFTEIGRSLVTRLVRLPIKIIIYATIAIGTFVFVQPTHALTSLQLKANLKKIKSIARQFKKQCRADLKLAKTKLSYCDLDADGLPNIFETKVTRTSIRKADTDGDGLSDREKILYGTNPRKKDTDAGGLSDGDEILIYHSNPLDGSDDHNFSNGGNQGACTQPSFNANGETTGFGIPNGLVGRINLGIDIWNSTCSACHQPATLKDNRTYQQISAAFSILSMSQIQHPPQLIADITAYSNRNHIDSNPCVATTPSPVGTQLPTPIPTPTPTPYAPPTPCPGGNFDGQGNTTAFGIPTPIVGNITQGLNQYNSSCGSGGCHGNQNNGAQVRGLLLHFPALKAAVTGPLMNLSPSDQQFANLVAYLNQSDPGGCSQPPPPTPTPNPVAQGMAIFMSSCTQGTSGCHALRSDGLPRELGSAPSKQKIHNALRNGPDEMPTFWNFTLGPTAPPYSDYEINLWSYLQSLPW